MINLLRAADAGLISLVKQMVTRSPSLIRACRHKDPLNRSFNVDGSAIHYACRSGHLNAVRFLIEQDPSIVNDLDIEHWTPLHYACYNGHKSIVELLVKSHADVSIRDTYLHQTPIQFAMYRQFEDIVHYLDATVQWTRRSTDEIVQKGKAAVFRKNSNLFLGRYRLNEKQKAQIEQFRDNPQAEPITVGPLEDLELDSHAVRLEFRHDFQEHLDRTLSLASNNDEMNDGYLRSSSTSTNEHLLVLSAA